MTPPKKILVKSDCNEMELSGTFGSKKGAMDYQYTYTKSNQKLGQKVVFEIKTLQKMLDWKVFVEIKQNNQS